MNLLFAVPAAIAALRLIENVAQPARPRLDLAGAALATSGLFALVYGFSNSETHSWGHPVTIIALGAAVVLLAAFVFVESRVEHPLLPLRVIADRVRGGSYLAIGISGTALFAVFLFLTYYLQQTKGFSPIETGLAYLPMTAAIMITATSVNIKFLAKTGPRPLLVLGMVLGALAMVWFAQLETDSSYVGHVLPGLIVMGIGMGNIFAPAISSATYGVDPRGHGRRLGDGEHDAAGRRLDRHRAAELDLRQRRDLLRRGPRRPGPQLAADAAMHGYTVAFWVAARRVRLRRGRGRHADALDQGRGARAGRGRGRARLALIAATLSSSVNVSLSIIATVRPPRGWGA